MLNKGLYSSNSNCWETPNDLFAKLYEEFAFTLDVCASKDNAKCEIFFSEDDDGLKQEWVGSCWMNPPYGRGINHWVEKAYQTGQTGHSCICLLPVRSDTRWWHNYVMNAKEIRLLSRRLSFQGSTNKAPFPAAIVIFQKTTDPPKLTSFWI